MQTSTRRKGSATRGSRCFLPWTQHGTPLPHGAFSPGPGSELAGMAGRGFGCIARRHRTGHSGLARPLQVRLQWMRLRTARRGGSSARTPAVRRGMAEQPSASSHNPTTASGASDLRRATWTVEVRGTSRRATAPAEEGGGRGHGGAGGVRKQWRRGARER